MVHDPGRLMVNSRRGVQEHHLGVLFNSHVMACFFSMCNLEEVAAQDGFLYLSDVFLSSGRVDLYLVALFFDHFDELVSDVCGCFHGSVVDEVVPAPVCVFAVEEVGFIDVEEG